MQNTELLTVVNGGIQTIIPEALLPPQVIYLDFDGEWASYHNHDLDIQIDDVEVEDSGLGQERIAVIVKELNRQFCAQNVVFVTEQPSDAEFSTIYVGKTDSFSEYGDFAGLAETVDVGNKIKNDNAFVMLDSTTDDASIVTTISHEAQHLLGTLEHGGENLQTYTYSNINSNHTILYKIITSGYDWRMDRHEIFPLYHGFNVSLTNGMISQVYVNSCSYYDEYIITAGGGEGDSFVNFQFCNNLF